MACHGGLAAADELSDPDMRPSVASLPQTEALGGDNAESHEAEAPPLSPEQDPNANLSTRGMLQHLHSMIPKTKTMSLSPFVSHALKEAESFGQVSSPKEALNMLKAVYSHFTVDLHQMVILLQV